MLVLVLVLVVEVSVEDRLNKASLCRSIMTSTSSILHSHVLSSYQCCPLNAPFGPAHSSSVVCCVHPAGALPKHPK